MLVLICKYFALFVLDLFGHVWLRRNPRDKSCQFALKLTWNLS
jgi:hypothetical protein